MPHNQHRAVPGGARGPLLLGRSGRDELAQLGRPHVLLAAVGAAVEGSPRAVAASAAAAAASLLLIDSGRRAVARLFMLTL